jgi:hypothetical protein
MGASPCEGRIVMEKVEIKKHLPIDIAEEGSVLRAAIFECISSALK